MGGGGARCVVRLRPAPTGRALSGCCVVRGRRVPEKRGRAPNTATPGRGEDRSTVRGLRSSRARPYLYARTVPPEAGVFRRKPRPHRARPLDPVAAAHSAGRNGHLLRGDQLILVTDPHGFTISSRRNPCVVGWTHSAARRPQPYPQRGDAVSPSFEPPGYHPARNRRHLCCGSATRRRPPDAGRTEGDHP